MHVVRLPRWHWPEMCDAEYYGYRMALVIGPLVLFMFTRTGGREETDDE